MNVPKYLWDEAVLTATNLINRMPSRVLGFTSPRDKLLTVFPHCLLLSKLPFKTFGCTAYVYSHTPGIGKLDRRSIKCIFLGYSGSQKGYKCFCPTTRKFYTTMNVFFDENASYYSSPDLDSNHLEQENYWSIIDVSPMGPLPNSTSDTPSDTSGIRDNVPSPRPEQEQQQERLHLPITQVYSRRQTQVSDQVSPSSPVTELPHPTNASDDHDLPIAVRKGKRECIKYHKFMCNKGYSTVYSSNYPLDKVVSYDRLNSNFRTFTVNIGSHFIPKTISEALCHEQWKQAVQDEISALIKNQTWELVTRPKDVSPVGCKWVFSLKYNSDGTLNKHKAMLVAKGFTQSYGIDYSETFAPVAKLNTIRIIFSLAVNLDWKLAQLDIKNVFLNGELQEQVFMSIPPGFESTQTLGKICRLKKQFMV